MTDWSKIAETVVGGLATGGISGLTTWLAAFRDLRTRLTTVEEKVGKSDEPKTGLYLLVTALDEAVRRIQRRIDSWEDDPPSWAARLATRTRTTSTINLADQRDFEERIERKVREIQELFEDLKRKHVRIDPSDLITKDDLDLSSLVTRADYERDNRARSEELFKIREGVASTNGLLRGVMAALDLTQPDGDKDGRG